MSIRLSQEAGEITNRLQRALRLPERPPILRLALALGLTRSAGTVPDQKDSKGPEIPMKVLLQKDEPLYDSLFIQEFPAVQSPLDAAERRRVCKCLVDEGVGMLWKEYERLGKPSDFLARLTKATSGG